MARIDQLLDAAYQAVPTTGTISYADLVQTLRAAGNEDALPLLNELKRRRKVQSKLAWVNGVVVHTYQRLPSGGE